MSYRRRRHEPTHPHNTVFDVKHLIGSKFDNAEVQADMRHLPFQVVSKDGKPYVEHKGEQKESVSAECL